MLLGLIYVGGLVISFVAGFLVCKNNLSVASKVDEVSKTIGGK